ncbi:GNAT family N-acetyltransferase [Kribbella sp. CA-293567]|uniref:GNAT family N-acetyltransferase n=1 Tax=Kribbella sp. CA-293567 TaxID=3002436 RepID=UPI0022DE4DF3|nr:GNAT family N-acetyltransferase [Kribbella sp. CA-293567]WBQ07228.1 GNAT family N-acetyltransferase [Kribbella sp. CA-293567]
MKIEIRRAELADAEAGAWCHVKCWQEAYADQVDPVRLAETTSDVAQRVERWTQRLESGVLRWVAINPDPAAAVEDRVIGFSSPGPTRDEDAPTPLELYAIYVRETWWGTGLGRRLMHAAIGEESASLWVLEGNERAKAFYRRQGFVEDGTRVDEPFFGVPEIRMVRAAR